MICDLNILQSGHHPTMCARRAAALRCLAGQEIAAPSGFFNQSASACGGSLRVESHSYQSRDQLGVERSAWPIVTGQSASNPEPMAAFIMDARSKSQA